MQLFQLGDELTFPPPDLANEEGILAFGGDLRPERIMLGYHQGIFPWYSKDTPILWWSPDPRFVLYPNELHVSKSTRQVLRKGIFEVTFDCAFEQVINACQQVPRVDQDGTWITDALKAAYIQIHQLGFAHSVEVWKEGELVGGLYGVNIGKVYFGESMFSFVSNASKIGFISLVNQLKKEGVSLIDCQVETQYLRSLGGRNVPRHEFLKQLNYTIDDNSLNYNWSIWNDTVNNRSRG